jgi:hypothetical protein
LDTRRDRKDLVNLPLPRGRTSVQPERRPAPSADQTQIAQFFATSNPVVQYHSALCTYLEDNPIGLERTATLFATSEAAVADSAIHAWRAKYDYRFWRPFDAIRGGDNDGYPHRGKWISPNPEVRSAQS